MGSGDKSSRIFSHCRLLYLDAWSASHFDFLFYVNCHREMAKNKTVFRYGGLLSICCGTRSTVKEPVMDDPQT